MKKIPTAQELHGKFLDTHKRKDGHCFQACMKEFVKLHLEAQRKAIQKMIYSQEWIDNFINLHDKKCKYAIKNAYPLKKIL
jgi:hypothetical protein